MGCIMAIDISKGIDDGGGYDLNEIAQAREGLKLKKAGEGVPKDVDPMYIEVTGGEKVKTRDMGQRTVFIDYDKYGNIVGVELL